MLKTLAKHDGVDSITSAIEKYEVLLSAVEMKDVSSKEGGAVLEQVTKHNYSAKILLGLFRHLTMSSMKTL